MRKCVHITRMCTYETHVHIIEGVCHCLRDMLIYENNDAMCP